MADNKNSKTKKLNQIRTKNVLEAINDIGSSVASTALDETKAISDEFFRQLLGKQKTQREKKSADLAK